MECPARPTNHNYAFCLGGVNYFRPISGASSDFMWIQETNPKKKSCCSKSYQNSCWHPHCIFIIYLYIYICALLHMYKLAKQGLALLWGSKKTNSQARRGWVRERERPSSASPPQRYNCDPRGGEAPGGLIIVKGRLLGQQRWTIMKKNSQKMPKTNSKKIPKKTHIR